MRRRQEENSLRTIKLEVDMKYRYLSGYFGTVKT